MKKSSRGWLIAGAIGVLLVGASLVFLSTFSAANPPAETALAEFNRGSDVQLVLEDRGSHLLLHGDFPPDWQSSVDRAFLFYPGAKVRPEAYVANLAPIAAAGYPVFILKFPFNFAVFAPDSGKPVLASNPEIRHWTLAGHSLGGVVAGWEIADQAEAGNAGTDSLVLFGSLPDEGRSLVGLDIRSLSLAGEHDLLATPEEVRDGLGFLPSGAEYAEISGGNHAQFGSYGSQSGDGQATISWQAQRDAAAAAVLKFLGTLSN